MFCQFNCQKEKKGRRKESTPAERVRIEDHAHEEIFCMSSVGLTLTDSSTPNSGRLRS